jgi:hypothetical protein
MAKTEDTMNALTIRQATTADETKLQNLAQLDSSRPLQEPVLVGQVGDELWAAVSLADFEVVSDPFRPSGELAFVLVERARQIERAERRRNGRQRRRAGGLRLAA